MSQVSLRTLPPETARPSRTNAARPKRYEGIFDGYNNLGTYSKAFDEMFDGQGNVRGPVQGHLRRACPVGRLRARGAVRRARAAPSSTRASPSRCRARSGRSRWTWCRG